MDPPFALVAHDPLLAVVAKIEVDLLAVETKTLLLVLPQAHLAQIFSIVLVGEVVLAGLVGLTDLVAAYVRIGLLLLLGGTLLGRGVALDELAHALLVLDLGLLCDAGGVHQTHNINIYS